MSRNEQKSKLSLSYLVKRQQIMALSNKVTSNSIFNAMDITSNKNLKNKL